MPSKSKISTRFMVLPFTDHCGMECSPTPVIQQNDTAAYPNLCYGETRFSLSRVTDHSHFALVVEASWNVMAHAQKTDFVFRRNGRVHLNRRGALVQSTTGSRVLRISGSNAGHTMFRGSVKSTGYSLHSPVSPSFPFPCATLCHHISTGL
jgi:hypothetical protein